MKLFYAIGVALLVVGMSVTLTSCGNNDGVGVGGNVIILGTGS